MTVIRTLLHSAGPNVGDKANCGYPDFTMFDKREGGGFVETGGKRVIILFASKGLGSYFVRKTAGCHV